MNGKDFIKLIKSGNFARLSSEDTRRVRVLLENEGGAGFDAWDLYKAYLDELGIKSLMYSSSRMFDANTLRMDTLERNLNDKTAFAGFDRLFDSIEFVDSSLLSGSNSAASRKNIKDVLLEMAKLETRIQLSNLITDSNGQSQISEKGYQIILDRNLVKLGNLLTVDPISQNNGKTQVSADSVWSRLANECDRFDNAVDQIKVRFKNSVIGKRLGEALNKIDAAGEKAFNKKLWGTARGLAKMTMKKDFLFAAALGATAMTGGIAAPIVLGAHVANCIYSKCFAPYRNYNKLSAKEKGEKYGNSFRRYARKNKAEVLTAGLHGIAAAVGLGALGTVITAGTAATTRLAANAATMLTNGGFEIYERRDNKPEQKKAINKLLISVGIFAAGIGAAHLIGGMLNSTDSASENTTETPKVDVAAEQTQTEPDYHDSHKPLNPNPTLDEFLDEQLGNESNGQTPVIEQSAQNEAGSNETASEVSHDPHNAVRSAKSVHALSNGSADYLLTDEDTVRLAAAHGISPSEVVHRALLDKLVRGDETLLNALTNCDPSVTDALALEKLAAADKFYNFDVTQGKYGDWAGPKIDVVGRVNVEDCAHTVEVIKPVPEPTPDIAPAPVVMEQRPLDINITVDTQIEIDENGMVNVVDSILNNEANAHMETIEPADVAHAADITDNSPEAGWEPMTVEQNAQTSRFWEGVQVNPETADVNVDDLGGKSRGWVTGHVNNPTGTVNFGGQGEFEAATVDAEAQPAATEANAVKRGWITYYGTGRE